MLRIPKILLILCAALQLASTSALAESNDPVFYRPATFDNLPFSEAVAYGGILYMSGQIGTDETNNLVPGGIQAETRQIMENFRAVLAKHGLGMERVIKCTVFLADIAEWQAFNEVYVSYFEPARLPARSALGASGLALNARAEVECMAATKQP